MTEFIEFRKIPRLSREVVITEKIDGTNGCIYVGEDGEFLVGSRSKWIDTTCDNHGFARWAFEHKDELIAGLGIGRHFGEWWGQGIQRKYGLKEKRFSLFNVSKWNKENIPQCCHVVPILYRGIFDTTVVEHVLDRLAHNGSYAERGFMQPEGIVIYHIAAGVYFKKTFENDASGKGET